MKKINRMNELIKYNPSEEEFHPRMKNWEISGDAPRKAPTINPNIECDCGSKKFGVCWWDYPYTGGYCKITCSECGEELLLIDDYS